MIGNLSCFLSYRQRGYVTELQILSGEEYNLPPRLGDKSFIKMTNQFCVIWQCFHQIFLLISDVVMLIRYLLVYQRLPWKYHLETSDFCCCNDLSGQILSFVIKCPTTTFEVMSVLFSI